MLTATFTLVSLSVEQASVRRSLLSFQKLLHSNFIKETSLTGGQTRYAVDALQRLYSAVHWGKVEMLLIPAIRSAGSQAERVIAELDALRRAAADALKRAGRYLLECAIDTEARVMRFCQLLDGVCQTLLRRIDKEEQELFPIARACISGEAWFSIANQMLLHEAYREESKRPRAGTGPAREAAPVRRLAPPPAMVSTASRRA